MTETADARTTGPAGTTWGRAWSAFGVMAGVGVASLFAFPPLVLMAVFLAGPPLLGVFFTNPPRDRATFSANGVAAAAGGAIAGAIWVATHPGDSHPMAVVVSTFVTFLVMSVITGLVVWGVSLRFPEAD